MRTSTLINQLRRLRFTYRVKSRIPDRFWAGEFLRLNVDPESVRYESDLDVLRITDLGLDLTPENAFFVKGIGYARSLQEEAEARFENVGDLIVIRIKDLSFELRTFEELFILHEVFVEGVYNVKLPHSAVVVDIGANVGFSSVLFAHDPSVLRVFSFEPVTVTYQHALRNFSLNEKYSGKIEAHNYGLSDKTESIEIDFSDEVKGSIGIRGLAHRDDIDRTRIRKEKLSLVEAGPALRKILDRYKSIPVLLKIDCEGSEYRIVENLKQHGMLEEVDGIMMEWHDAARLLELETNLTSAGFTVFSLSPNSVTVGMIYAYKSARQDLG